MKNIFNFIYKKTKLLVSNSEGQSLVIIAISLVVLLGIGSLTTDVGFLYVQRRDAQNTADAASLAGTWKIQNGFSEVEKEVKDYAIKNGLSATDVKNVEIIDGKSVKVDIERDHELFFAKVIGVNNAKISATATATRSSIWNQGHKDILPIGLLGWEDYFYKVKNHSNNIKENDEFQGRPGILKDSIRDYLLANYPSEKKIIGSNSISEPTLDNLGINYPTKASEKLIQTNLEIYKKALKIIMETEPNTIFNIILEDNKSGSFAFMDLDGSHGGGASTAGDIIKNGYKDMFSKILPETGGMTSLDSALDYYIKNRGNEAYILAILPDAIGTGQSWNASRSEYLIIRVKDLKLNPESKVNRLTGKVVEIFNYEEVILPGVENKNLLPKSWLIK